MGAANPLVHTYFAADGKGVVLMMLQSERFWPLAARTLGLRGPARRPALRHAPRSASARPRRWSPSSRRCSPPARAHEWAERLNASECIWAPLQSPAEIPADPQVIANGYVQEFEHPAHGRFRVTASPVQFANEAPDGPPRRPGARRRHRADAAGDRLHVGGDRGAEGGGGDLLTARGVSR